MNQRINSKPCIMNRQDGKKKRKKPHGKGRNGPGFDFRTDDIPETEQNEQPQQQGPCQNGKSKMDMNRPPCLPSLLQQWGGGGDKARQGQIQFHVPKIPLRLSLSTAIGGRERVPHAAVESTKIRR